MENKNKINEILEKYKMEMEEYREEYIKNIEKNREGICKKCNEVIDECRKYKENL